MYPSSLTVVILLCAISTVTGLNRPSSVINCTLTQHSPGYPHFAIDAKADPILVYKGKADRTTTISLYVSMSGHILRRNTEYVPSCADGDCIKFYVPSESPVFKERFKLHQKIVVIIDFRDYDPEVNSEILYVRTNHCGQFSYNTEEGIWESDRVGKADVSVERFESHN